MLGFMTLLGSSVSGKSTWDTLSLIKKKNRYELVYKYFGFPLVLT